jgi:hypothetical protein
MEKVNKFFEKHGSKLIIILLILVYFKSCTVNTELTKVKKELLNTQKKIDSTNVLINNFPTKIDLEIEGLKSEKRMIQATDRRIFDVNRQNQIELEIKNLEQKK